MLNQAYSEYAFIVFMLMGSMMPLEKSLKIAELQLSDKWPAHELATAKDAVIKKIETGFEEVAA